MLNQIVRLGWWRIDDRPNWETHLMKQCLFFELVKSFSVCVCTCTHMSWPENMQTEKESLPILWGLFTKSLRHFWPCFMVYLISGLHNFRMDGGLGMNPGSSEMVSLRKGEIILPLEEEWARGDPVMYTKHFLKMWWANVGPYWGLNSRTGYRKELWKEWHFTARLS